MHYILTDKARYDKVVESFQDIINRNLSLEDLYLKLMMGGVRYSD